MKRSSVIVRISAPELAERLVSAIFSYSLKR
jgi:hypothetical protein